MLLAVRDETSEYMRKIFIGFKILYDSTRCEQSVHWKANAEFSTAYKNLSLPVLLTNKMLLTKVSSPSSFCCSVLWRDKAFNI